MIYGISWRQFARDLQREVRNDNVSNGAAALAYYLIFSIFPAMIALLSVLPYLPVPHLDQAIFDFLREILPEESGDLFRETVTGIMSQRREGLFIVSLSAAIWSASSGLSAVIKQLNIAYDVKEARPAYKARIISVVLTLVLGVLVIVAFALIVFGGVAQDWLSEHFGWGSKVNFLFSAGRWVTIFVALFLGLAITYYFGPNVKQKFQFVSPGGIIGVILLLCATLAFRFYVANFGNFNAAYGSIGAVIILLLWLYIMGWVLLLGAEVNALIEYYRAERQPYDQPRGVREGVRRQAEAGFGYLLGAIALFIAIWKERKRSA